MVKLKTEINGLLERRDALVSVESSNVVPIDTLVETTALLRSKIDSAIAKKECDELKEEYSRSVQEYFDTTRETIESLEKSLLSEEDRLKIDRSLQEYEELNASQEKLLLEYEMKIASKNEATLAINEIRTLTTERYVPKPQAIKTVPALRKTLTALLNNFQTQLGSVDRKRVICPCCKESLYFDGEALFQGETTPETESTKEELVLEISELQKWLKQIDDHYADYSSKFTKPKLKNLISLDQVKEMSIRLKENETVLAKIAEQQTLLQSRKLSPQLSRLKRKIETLKKEIVHELTEEETVDTLKSEYERSNTSLRQRQRDAIEVTHLQRQIDQKKKLLASASRKFASNNLEEKIEQLESVLSLESNRLIELISVNSEITQAIKEIEQYRLYLKERDELTETVKKLAATENEIETAEKRIPATLELMKLSKKAELLAIDQTVETLNLHAKSYIDRMFSDHISVRLKFRSTTKKGEESSKPQMMIEIDYNGYNYNTIDELSAGERQRCDLSFMLAVNEILGGKMLLLDECFNNMDPELNAEMMNLIKETASDRQVIVVSQEAVTGLFDHVIPLSK